MSSADTFNTGDIIDGRYRIDEFVGEGSRSVVFGAMRLDTGQQVALKVLHSPLSQDQRFRARFQREIRAMAALGHPNVLTVYGAGRTGGRDYMVTQLMQAPLLAELMAETGPMQGQDAQEVTRQICSGVAAAHDAGVSHRDLRPRNIFVARLSETRFHVTIGGFGMARMVGHRITTTEEGTPIGAPDYLPPELADSSYTLGNDPLKLAHADVYAIGCIAFALLHGRPPLVAERALETLMRRLLTPDVDWEPDIASVIAPEFKALVDRMLSVAPEKRPTAVELVDALAGDRTTRGGPIDQSPRPQSARNTMEWGASPIQHDD